jgi:hypothetical protein
VTAAANCERLVLDDALALALLPANQPAKRSA